MLRSFIIAMLAVCTLGVCLGQSQSIGVLNLCKVAANVRMFNGHEIQLTGFLGVGKEQAVLYDPKCQDGKPLMYAGFTRDATGEIKTLRRLLQKKPHAAVIVEGTVRSGEPIKVAPNLPDWLKDRFKDSADRYSHPGPIDMMIEIDRVISAKDLDDGLKPIRR